MSVSNTKSWLRTQEIAQQRIFMRALALSFALHVGVALIFSFAPKPKPVRSLAVLSVRMVTLPAAAPAPRAAPAKTPTPKPLPAQPKPVPIAKKVILPKRAASVEKKPKPKPKPKPLDYDDALAALREELGEELPPPDAPAAQQETAQVEASKSSPTPSSGTEADPEIVAWRNATLRHLRGVWRVPKEFMNRLLLTEVIVTLSSTGDVLGKPKITVSSSDPYWDDNVLRALSSASPLPPPPTAGDWTFRFTPEEGN